MRWTACGVSPTWPIDRNLGVDQPLDQLQTAAAALDLDCFCAALFDEAHRIRHAFSDRGVI